MLRIYVASLSDYNDGRYHGVHIDLEGKDEDDVWAEIKAMLKASPIMKDPFYMQYGMVAEEWAIHDYEGFYSYRLREYESIGRVVKIAGLIDTYGAPAAAWISNDESVLDSDDLEEAYNDAHMGYAEDEKAYAFEYISQVGSYKGIPFEVFDENYNIFDWDAIAADIMQDCFTVNDDNEGIHVFSMVR